MKTFYKFLASAAFLSAVVSCSDEEYDDYKKFAAGGEINYTEKIDSVKAFPGDNRIMLQGVVDADPKITEFRVYWNAQTDSVVVPITRDGAVDTLEVMINDIPENIYNFELKTFDAQGNSSLISNVTAPVYGERYRSSLFNRPMLANDLRGDSLNIGYGGMDLTTGVIGTEIERTVDGQTERMFIGIDEDTQTLKDFQFGDDYKYRTVFLPEERAIDTFYTDFVRVAPRQKVELENSTAPFETIARNGRWGTLADWEANSAALHRNGVGGFDDNTGLGLMALESWGANDAKVRNAKIYQVVAVEDADYAFNVNVRAGNKLGDPDTRVYVVVARGADGLPDVGNVTSSTDVLGYLRVTSPGNVRVEFDASGETEVSVGLVSDFTLVETYWNVSSVDMLTDPLVEEID